MKEIWKPIENYEDLYEISNYGYVKSLHWGRKRILKANLTGKGYFYIRLCKNGKQKMYKMSHLVWDHFGDKPRNGHLLQVDHIKEKWNDRIDNLQLLSNRQNVSKWHKAQKTSSKYIGVSWNKLAKSWIARIRIDKKYKHLGCFDNELEASKVYQKVLRSLK